MTQTLSVKQAYELSNAFIADKGTTIKATCDSFSQAPFMRFEFTNDTMGATFASYQLIIFIPFGTDNEFLKKRGEICLLKTDKRTDKTTTVFTAKTSHSVGCAFDKKQSDITRAFTRMLSPRFFKLVENTEKRISQKTKPTDNSLKIFREIYRIENNQR